MGRHLAQFNWGVLRADWESPVVADFVNGLDRVNAAAARSDGFVWQLSDDEMETAQLDPEGPLGGNPRLASTLSVWRDLAALERFVWRSVHKVFYDRRAEWFAPGQGLRLALWWVPEGTRPTLAEAAERAEHLRQHGDSDVAFGWDHARRTAA
ncbi:DUF3291 domain-containing protein [Psychromarinibacter sp. C21-152]|uniref:DUF3291 domain-containing protein n=1 Tax=Psychromarinibacter sediminicola TaxID=3033385 RepID=A0AAE3T7P2_9RHOB|nr:DUF3291 domain-containing protein [Psychromarinibacter sediminicola]MDF0599229.1 DUF3291 domain-containing protein [Psychromarinibacter sediminicola]